MIVISSDIRKASWWIQHTSRGAPNVKVSISSLAAAYTLSAFAKAAHCASASQGASITGIPISRSKRLQSSECVLSMRTIRLEKRSISSKLPASFAASRSFSAFSFRSVRLASCNKLNVLTYALAHSTVDTAYLSPFQCGSLAIKNISRLDSAFDELDRTVPHSLQMTATCKH
jgi:hypothetical protein